MDAHTILKPRPFVHVDMHKDELLELHEELVIIMEYFADREEVDAELFEPYRQLDVDPSHVHKSKSEHKHAVFVLGNASQRE